MFALDPVSGASGLILQKAWQVFAVGCLGGIAGDLLALAETRKQAAPEYVKRGWYWMGASIYAVFGGIIAVLYFGNPLNAILVFNIGTSIPLIGKSASTSAGRIRTQRID